MLAAQEHSSSHADESAHENDRSSINLDRDELLEQIMKEANYFTLASHFFWTLWAINMATSTAIKFGYMVRRERLGEQDVLDSRSRNTLALD